ncbi:MAG: hypothetical protein JXM73_02750 [Anaerolineae bacterium]|nr:hypothetical protein [Anaerolineae bacterium]
MNRSGRSPRRIPIKQERAWKRTCQVWLKVLALWAGVLMAALLGPNLAWADEPNRAGLVVQFADGQTKTVCVEFEGEAITGADLLTRSGLDAVVDPSSGMGIIVCQIEGQGCDYPAEACFCQCSGSGTCAYWNYFYREPGQDGWTYATLGVLRHKARPGSVEAWVWGDGGTPPAADLTFEAVCPSPTPAVTQAATSMPQETAPQVEAATSMPSPEPAQTQRVEMPTAVATPSPSGEGPGPEGREGASSYWLFGGLVLILAFGGALVWLRTRK